MTENRSVLDRRQFLILTLSASAAFLLGEKVVAAPTRTFRGALEELPAGAVKPLGWLKSALEKQAAGLGSQLTKVSWPFTEPYWKNAQPHDGFWWPWEQMAYWIDGATRLALILGDKDLMSQVRQAVDQTLASIDFDGYVGPAAFKDPVADFHRWPHALFFRALTALADAGHAAAIPEALTAHFLLDRADYGKSTRNVVNVETMLWCYGRTGDARLLALAEKAWKDYLTVAGDPERGDLSEARVAANAPINAHGVTYIETAKLPAILSIYTGKQSYLDFALAAQRRVFDHHMLIDGIPSTSEWYRGTTSLDMHETCDIADHTWTWGYLLKATGDGEWGDRIERAIFNAGFGAIKKDWKAVQYFSCPNQAIATLDSDHGVMEHGGRMMAFQPNPGQGTACCGGNVHRVLPNYVIRMWMRSPGGGLAATHYGPSRVTTTVGPHDVPVTIVQTTDYPFDEQIYLKLSLAQKTRFELRLRVPAWCAEPHLTINGHSIPVTPQNGFVALNREFRNDDAIVLTLPMKTLVSHWPEDGVAVEHGPLVYALPVDANWSPVVEPRFTTEAYPSWNATPLGAWNYALNLGELVFERGPMTEDPWSHPPTRLSVRARRVEGWDFVAGKSKDQRFMPPLPTGERLRFTGPVERLSLTPYGSTHLRMTIFPQLP